MPKTVFQNRLRKQIPADVWALGEDAIDAYCIAIAGCMMLETKSKKLKKLGWHK